MIASDTARTFASQDAAATYHCTRPEMLGLLAARTADRLARVRRTLKRDGALPDEDLPALYHSALGRGVYRALALRFIDEHGLDADTLRDLRRRHARNGRDKSMDDVILRREYPAFTGYIPPLTDDEVLAAAALDFRDQIAGVGSDYHQTEFQHKLWREQIGFVKGEALPQEFLVNYFYRVPERSVQRTVLRSTIARPVGGEDYAGLSESRTYDFLDERATAITEDADLRRFVEDDANVLGPCATRVATLALQQYGPSALHWLAEFLFLPGKYTEVLRLLGQDEATLGTAEFERVKRDMARKLPEMRARMLEILRADPEMAEMYERVRCAAPTAAPAPVTTPGNYHNERQKALARIRTRMVDAIRAEPSTTHLADLVNAGEATDTMTTLMATFNGAENEAMRLAFFKLVRKRYGKTDA